MARHTKQGWTLNPTYNVRMKLVADTKKTPKSPFDVPGIKTKATTQDIVDAVREFRSRE